MWNSKKPAYKKPNTDKKGLPVRNTSTLLLTAIRKEDGKKYDLYVNSKSIAAFNRSASGEDRTVLYLNSGIVFDVVEAPKDIEAQISVALSD